MKLFQVTAKLFRVNSDLVLSVPAHTGIHAAKKVKHLLDSGKLFVTNTRTIPAHTQDGQPVPEQQILVTSRIEGILEHADIEEVWHTAFHKARWTENENGKGKFASSPPRYYYHGRRLADDSIAQGTHFATNRLNEYIATKHAQAAQANAATAHAQEDYSPRCKNPSNKLKARLKNLTGSTEENRKAYSKAYAAGWDAQVIATRNATTTKTPTTRKKKATATTAA